MIPEPIRHKGIAASDIHELVVTADLRERKKAMEERADAFIAMPGGFGTMEELLEVVTLRQLRLHRKPIVLLNVEGFWDPLLGLFDQFYRTRFTKEAYRGAYAVAADAAEALDLAEAEAGDELPDKWFSE